jgi:hypothetical protein
MCSSECLRSVRRRRGVKGLLTRRKQANSSRTQKRSRSRSKGLFVFLGPHTPGVVDIVTAFSKLILRYRPTAYGTAAFLFITLWSAKLAGSKRLSCVYSEVLHISQDSARGHCALGGLYYGIRVVAAFSRFGVCTCKNRGIETEYSQRGLCVIIKICLLTMYNLLVRGGWA